WDRADQDGFGDPARAVAAHVPDDLTTTGGVTHEDDVAQIKMVEQGSEVVGVRVEIVAVPRLAGTAVAPTVVGDGAEAIRCHVPQLVVPHIGGERPAVAEHHRLAGAPVLVEDLGAVLGSDRSGAHAVPPESCPRAWVTASAETIPFAVPTAVAIMRPIRAGIRRSGASGDRLHRAGGDTTVDDELAPCGVRRLG